jgi:hypothetical protein
MRKRRISVTPYRVALFIATVWGLTQILFLIDANFSRAKQFQESDYIMTFYVAGHLIASGRAADLYPAADTTSFIGASFDKAAHTLLDSLPEKTTAIYMYSPLVAWLFAPLSQLGPNLSLLAWQGLSILALIISCKLIAQSLEINFAEGLFFCSLFGPIFITLWSGQLGLVLGLLPLSIGYFLFLRGFPLVAGLIWSLLLLKPQYFPAVGFVSLIIAIRGNFRVASGLFFGVLAIVSANLLLFSPALVIQWLVSHRLSDTIFTHAQYGIPTHLITSLPADFLLLLPHDMRPAMKWPAYSVSMLLWMVGVYICWRFYCGPWQMRTKFSLTVAIGCILSSIVLPHLLYYDLCILIPAGFMLATTNVVVPETIASRMIAPVAWVSISFYLPVFLFFTQHVGVALLLEIIILGCLIWLVAQINRALNRQMRYNSLWPSYLPR